MAFVFSILLVSVVADRGQVVRHNYLPGQDFSKYKTYKWVEVSEAQYPDQILDEQIKRAIDAQLSAKGFTKSDADDADLRVTYQLAITEEKEWKAYKTGNEYWGWGGWGGWGGSTTKMKKSTIRVGTLNIDFYDVTLKKQVWRGEATKTLKNPKNPGQLQKNLDIAMAKLLEDFPPLGLK